MLMTTDAPHRVSDIQRFPFKFGGLDALIGIEFVVPPPRDAKSLCPYEREIGLEECMSITCPSDSMQKLTSLNARLAIVR